MKSMLSLLLVLGCMFITVHVYSQQQNTSGTVHTTNGDAIIGATVRVKGSQTGTITDEKGRFSIAAAQGDTLEVSYIGMQTQRVAVGTAPLTIVLDFENARLNDVVVLGYETTTRKSVTSSIASVSADDIAGWTTGNVANALEGKVPGLHVVSGGGLPGAQPKILIHGLSSISNNTSPLVIMDGIEVGYNALNFLNPSDIESIDVLEDASAAAIYGARSGQGVIVVTTKKGSGKAVVHLTATNGMSYLPDIHLAGAKEYARTMNQEAEASAAPAPFADPSQLKGTDYWGMAFDPGYTQNYVISASGSTDKLSLYGSLGYYKEDSYNETDKGGYWRKITGHFKGDLDISKVFKMGMTLAPRYETWLSSPQTIYAAYAMDPTTAPYKSEDSVYRAIPEDFMDMTAFNPYYSRPNRSAFNGVVSPMFSYLTNFNEHEAFALLYGTYLQAEPLPGLVLKTSVSGFVNASQANNYTPKYYLASNANHINTDLTSSTVVDARWQITNTVQYKFTLGEDHYLNVLAGQSADKYTYKGTSAGRQDIPLDDPSFRYISAAATVTSGSGSYQPGTSGQNHWGIMASYFGSLRYHYKEKYYLSGTFRADGSSLVNPKYRWGYFPTVSGAWVISEESFFESLSNTISYLKLRASWGESGGNLPGSTSAYLSVLSPTTYPDAAGDYVTGYFPSKLANPEIRWEIQKDYTIGLEASLFQNKWNITLEHFIRNPSNLLENVTVDYTLGYPQDYYPTQEANVGRMRTKGWDAVIRYQEKLGSRLHLEAGLTLNHFKSIVKDLGGMDPILGHEANDVIKTYRSRLTKGHEPGAWYGFNVLGVFQSDQQAVDYVNKEGDRLQPYAKAGDLQYEDLNGDGIIDNNDLTDLGSPWPDLTAGLNIQLRYRAFDFRTEFYGSWGAKYFQSYRLMMNPTGHLNFRSGDANKYWHGEGTSNRFPILRFPDQNGNFSNMSPFFLDDANFIKCNLMQLGFTVPTRWIPKIRNLRVYVSAQNLFTITEYSGLNPDLPWYNDVGYNGVDRFQALLPTTYLAGIDLSF